MVTPSAEPGSLHAVSTLRPFSGTNNFCSCQSLESMLKRSSPDINDPQFGQDAMNSLVCGHAVVAPCRSIVFVIPPDGGNPPASPAAAEVPADLARLDEAAA